MLGYRHGLVPLNGTQLVMPVGFSRLSYRVSLISYNETWKRTASRILTLRILLPAEA